MNLQEAIVAAVRDVADLRAASAKAVRVSIVISQGAIRARAGEAGALPAMGREDLVAANGRTSAPMSRSREDYPRSRDCLILDYRSSLSQPIARWETRWSALSRC